MMNLLVILSWHSMIYPYNTEFASIYLDDTEQVAILSWKRPVNLQEFKEGYYKLAALVQESNVRRWLIDFFDRGLITEEAEEWLRTEFFQTYPTIFTEPHLIALVMNEEHYQMTIHDYSLSRVNYSRLPISANFFTDVNEALEWIKEEPLPIN